MSYYEYSETLSFSKHCLDRTRQRFFKNDRSVPENKLKEFVCSILEESVASETDENGSITFLNISKNIRVVISEDNVAMTIY